MSHVALRQKAKTAHATNLEGGVGFSPAPFLLGVDVVESFLINDRRVRVYPGTGGHYIMVLHPLGGNIEYMERYLPIQLIPGDSRPTVILCDATRAPFGIASSFHAGKGVTGYASWAGVDDYAHLREVEGRVCKKYDGPPYILSYCGFSNGAYMSQTMAARTGRHAITFAGHLCKEWVPTGRSTVTNFVGTNERFAPRVGKIRIGSWMVRQEDYETQAAKWPGGHITREFVGGHEIPSHFGGEDIASRVVSEYALGALYSD